MQTFCSIAEAIAEFQAGKMVILVDDEDRENEGDLIIPAEKITPQSINFMLKYGRGLVCLALTEKDLSRLQLPLMVAENNSKYDTPFTISFEAAEGITSGISVYDRFKSIQVAIDPHSTPSDIVRPGHVFPLKARQGGVLVRPGHTEGSVNLAELAGFASQAVICEVLNDDGSSARLEDLQKFAREHDIKLISIKQIIAHRMQHECLVKEIAQSRLPTEHGEFTLKVFDNCIDGTQHVALIRGELVGDYPILVRVHSECVTGEVFGSTRCDCGWQLDAALARIGREGGVLLYMQQEGRGIGFANKIKAYALQDAGLDTVEANHKLGFRSDHRDYGIGSQILRALGLQQIKLLTNNPRKIYGLEGFGLKIVSREPIEMPAHADNQHYLQTKKNKLGHLFTALQEKV